MASRYLNLDQLIAHSLAPEGLAASGSLSLIDSIADGIFSVDLQHKITFFNRAAERLTGYSREEVVGRPFSEVLRASSCSSACPVIEALSTSQAVVNRELEILDCQGRKIPVSVSASALRNAAGELIGAVETLRDLSAIQVLNHQREELYSFQGIFSRSPLMHGLFDVLPDIAASEATVLVQGESGTGKELFARAIHQLSPRRDGPLVVVNCGALPEQLLEAEIFGAKRGAYTGAVESRPGRLEMAQGGTFFLDEIGDLPLPLQVKLLRVLENREFQPLGAKFPQQADVRFITATHRDMGTMVEEGTFRRDLFFRVNVVGFTIPPLRARKEDIPLLIDLTLDRLNGEYGKKIRGFSPPALQKLLNHQYRGNVRELLNIIEQMVIFCREGEIGVDVLPECLMQGDCSEISRSRQRGCPSVDELSQVLNRYQGNRNQAANEFGVDRSTLWRWMKRYKL